MISSSVSGMGPRTPSAGLNRYLASRGVSILYADSESSDIKASHMKNKVVFTTFHKSKGRERNVFVFGFDEVTSSITKQKET